MKKLVLLIFLFNIACQSTSNEISILNKSSCILPCLNGITVGQTSRDEVLRFIESLADVNEKSIQITNDASDVFDQRISFYFERVGLFSRDPRMLMDFHITNNIVIDMIVCNKLNTTMSDIVEQIGEPQSIISGDDFDGNRNVILINSAKGVSYWYTTDPSLGELQYKITPEVEIECLHLFEPSLYEEIMDTGSFSMGYYSAEETLRVMYPWDGYGNIAEKYPPRQP